MMNLYFQRGAAFATLCLHAIPRPRIVFAATMTAVRTAHNSNNNNTVAWFIGIHPL